MKNFKNSFLKILMYSPFIAIIMVIFFRNKCLFIWNSIESFVSTYNIPISSFIILFFFMGNSISFYKLCLVFITKYIPFKRNNTFIRFKN